MKKHYVLIAFLFLSILTTAQTVHITEIHYDNAGGDVGEFVEIFVTNPQPTILSDYEVTLYNGSGGASYNSETLDMMTQSTSDATNAIGTGRYYTWYPSSIQNGAPDGLATSGPSGLIEFLSYEGDFTATNGPADGQTSTDIGSSESGGTASGNSMQNNGAGVWTSNLP